MVVLHSNGSETAESDSEAPCSRCGEWAYHGCTTADVDVITRRLEHGTTSVNGEDVPSVAIHSSGQYVRVRLCESCIDALTTWMGF